MKILHILYESRGDYFGIGGVGERAYRIYDYIKDRHEITLLCKKYPGAIDKDIDGLKHLFVGTESKSFLKTLLAYAYHSAVFVKKHGENFDVIIEEFSPAIPAFLSLYKKRPVVLQIQGYTGKKYFEKYNICYSAVLYALERLRPKYYKDIIVVSDTTRERFKLNKNNYIQVISNGIPGELLALETCESDYILYLGRIDIHGKGLDILLNAYREFHGSSPGTRLVIAGDGRDMERFRGMIDSIPEKIKKKIQLTGWVEGERKKAIMKDALMVVIPSRYETQGIVVLEAMAYGKPVVASDIPELQYVADWGAGISFNAGNPHSLAGAMNELAACDKRREMGNMGRARVKNYTWEKIALKYEAFLHGVLSKSRSMDTSQ
jgi:glycosyltransferase involved in cell wall biosynthesis